MQSETLSHLFHTKSQRGSVQQSWFLSLCRRHLIGYDPVEQLAGKRKHVLGKELRNKIDELRERYRRDALPQRRYSAYRKSGSKAPSLRTALVLDVFFQNFNRGTTDRDGKVTGAPECIFVWFFETSLSIFSTRNAFNCIQYL